MLIDETKLNYDTFRFYLLTIIHIFLNCHSCETSLRDSVEKIHEFSLLNPKIDSGIYSKTRKTGMTVYFMQRKTRKAGMTVLQFRDKMCHTLQVWYICID